MSTIQFSRVFVCAGSCGPRCKPVWYAESFIHLNCKNFRPWHETVIDKFRFVKWKSVETQVKLIESEEYCNHVCNAKTIFSWFPFRCIDFTWKLCVWRNLRIFTFEPISFKVQFGMKLARIVSINTIIVFHFKLIVCLAATPFFSTFWKWQMISSAQSVNDTVWKWYSTYQCIQTSKSSANACN